MSLTTMGDWWNTSYHMKRWWMTQHSTVCSFLQFTDLQYWAAKMSWVQWCHLLVAWNGHRDAMWSQIRITKNWCFFFRPVLFVLAESEMLSYDALKGMFFCVTWWLERERWDTHLEQATWHELTWVTFSDPQLHNDFKETVFSAHLPNLTRAFFCFLPATGPYSAICNYFWLPKQFRLSTKCASNWQFPIPSILRVLQKT